MTKDDLSRLVLVAGPPRSGTTWLHRELCKSDLAHGFLPECTLVTQQVTLYSRTLNNCDAQRFAAYFGTTAALAEFYRDTIARMLDLVVTLRRAPGPRTLVLKDPELSCVLAEAGDVMPAHRLVVLIRDPRDVVASVRKVTMRKQETWDIQKAAAWIYTYYHGILQYRKKSAANARFARYEDLVDTGLDDLREFAALPLSPQMDEKKLMEDVQSNLDRSDPFFSELYLKSTTKDAVGAYRAILTDKEVAVVEKMFSGVMTDWGYQRA